MAKDWRETREEMTRVVERFRASGRTRREFARAAGITLSKLDYWTRRVPRRNGRGAARAARFLPVQQRVDGAAGALDLEIVLASGERLLVGERVSGERLREVVAALRR